MPEDWEKSVWVKVLNESPLSVRRRASGYLKSVRKTKESEWIAWSREGTRYKILLEKWKVTCSCPYAWQQKGHCKHVCAVAASELAKIEVIPWLKKLDEGLRNVR